MNTPAVIIATQEGAVSSQNTSARQLLGNSRGKYCWDVFGGLKDSCNLPCREGCVARLLQSGVNRSMHTDIAIGGREHRLSCIPVDGTVVCMVSREAAESPEPWQALTPRERDVLELLAAGENTQGAAASLGISESTVRTHVEKMLTRLGVKNRAALVATGFRLGYLS